MQRDLLVRCRFLQTGLVVAEHETVRGLAKLPLDEPGHPSGQWSVVAELCSGPNEHGVALGWLDFASPEAPTSMLFEGATFPLFVGPTPVAEVHVLLVHPRVTA